MKKYSIVYALTCLHYKFMHVCTLSILWWSTTYSGTNLKWDSYIWTGSWCHGAIRGYCPACIWHHRSVSRYCMGFYPFRSDYVHALNHASTVLWTWLYAWYHVTIWSMARYQKMCDLGDHITSIYIYPALQMEVKDVHVCCSLPTGILLMTCM